VSDTASLEAICNQGLSLHQAGHLDEARQRYEAALALDPEHFDALHMLGVFCIQTRQMDAALQLIGRAIAIRPDAVAAYGNLANALNSLGRHEEALAVCDRAIAIEPAFAPAHGNRGQALRALGRTEEALASYDRVLALKPTAGAHQNRATLLRDLGRLEDALASYERAIALAPNDADAHRSRGVTLADLGRAEEALLSYEQAIALKPAFAEAHFSRGAALRQLGRPAEALASQDRALALNPDYAEAHCNRANALVDLKRFEEALSSYETAIALRPTYFEAFSNMVVPLRELKRPQEAVAAADRSIAIRPDYAEAHSNRGTALSLLRRLDEALESFEATIALKPDYAPAYNNKGVALFELRRLDDAMASYHRAIALNPEFADAHHHQAMCRLALGDFARGWAQFEWRWRTPQFEDGRRHQDKPLWLGREALEGRTILLHGEQGFGDTLQFCRYATDVAARGAKVVLEVQPGLERLLSRLQGVDQVVRLGAAIPPCDFQTPMMSLPLALGGVAPEAGKGPYLAADPQDVAAWRARLATSGKRRIGLCWAGGFRPDLLVADSADKRRSLPLEAFAPLAGVDGVEIYSLQKGPPAAQLTEALARGWDGPPILDLTAELNDFADTAALVANLDLVITCDTAIAHVAGGLGVPVWILNRFDTCWRWMADRDDSPWYPSARLFRQTTAGDWAGVVQRVTDELSRTPAAAS
jgi:tetratricopeptide (TPR) repeat protein